MHIMSNCKSNLMEGNKMAEDNFNNGQQDETNKEGENQVTEKKHPVRDFCSKHKNKIILTSVGVISFILGACVGGTKKDKSDESSDIELLEEDNCDQDQVAETITTEISDEQ